MKTIVRIDVVSDLMCPWCAIGLASLNQALQAMSEKLQANITFQPFELNPELAAEGENLREHLMKKYGMTVEQSVQNREQITARGKALGVEFNFTDEMRMHNTFNAHQLLHFAKNEGKQMALKMALFTAHFRDQVDISKIENLVSLAKGVGLDGQQAETVLRTQQYAPDVRAKEQYWQEMGIHSVPAFILNEKYLISGGQPPESFVQALTELMKE